MKELIDIILHGEGLKLNAYLCPAGKWTIGIGNTFYADGKPVRQGDKITKEQAYKLAEFIALDFMLHVKKLVKKPITRNQLYALTSLAYNTGKRRFAESIILKMVNANPNNPAIKDQFLVSFITIDGVKNKGLINRRTREAKIYFTV